MNNFLKKWHIKLFQANFDISVRGNKVFIGRADVFASGYEVFNDDDFVSAKLFRNFENFCLKEQCLDFENAWPLSRGDIISVGEF